MWHQHAPLIAIGVASARAAHLRDRLGGLFGLLLGRAEDKYLVALAKDLVAELAKLLQVGGPVAGSPKQAAECRTTFGSTRNTATRKFRER